MSGSKRVGAVWCSLLTAVSLVLVGCGGGSMDSSPSAPTATTVATATPTAPPVQTPAPAPTSPTTPEPTTPPPAPPAPTAPSTTTYKTSFTGSYSTRGRMITQIWDGSCTTHFRVETSDIKVSLTTDNKGVTTGTIDSVPTFVETARCVQRSGFPNDEGNIPSSLMKPQQVDLGAGVGVPFPTPFQGSIGGSSGEVNFSYQAYSKVNGADSQFTATFAGKVIGDLIVGTLKVAHRSTLVNGPVSAEGNGAGEYPITLTRVQ